MSALEALYNRLHVRFPPLFELLLLSYRWSEKVGLGTCELLPNPPGEGFDGFLREISKDAALFNCLARGGFTQFARPTDGKAYDPLCFSHRARKSNGDRAIVRIDHEQILCNDRIKVVAEFAPSFEELMIRTIDRAT